MRKVAITGDIHLHPWVAFGKVTEDGVSSRLHDIEKVLYSIFQQAVKEGCDGVVLNGDIFHKRGVIDVTCMDVLVNLIRNYNHTLEIHIVVGNHDQAWVNEKIHALTALNLGDQNVAIYSSPTLQQPGILFVPYSEDHLSLQYQIEELARKSTRPLLLVGHFGVTGAKMLPTDYKSSSGVHFSSMDTSNIWGGVLSHYHAKQLVHNNPPIYYVGSPIHHTFHDCGLQKYFAIADLNDKTIEFRELSGPQFHVIEVADSTNLYSLPLRSNDYYNFVLSSPALRRGVTNDPDLLDHLSRNTRNYMLSVAPQSRATVTEKSESDLAKLALEYVKQNVPTELRRDVWRQLNHDLRN